MRKRLCALMMILPLLAGCGRGEQSGAGSAEEAALSIRTEYLAMTACTATVDLTADYGQRVYEYTLSLSWKKGGETVLIVLAPENIAGVTARFDGVTGYLEFDGVRLETGTLPGNGLSPMETVPELLDCICSGYIAECDFEQIDGGQQLWILCRAPECSPGTGVETALWFDMESHALVRAEVYSDGYTVLQCAVTEFTKE